MNKKIRSELAQKVMELIIQSNLDGPIIKGTFEEALDQTQAVVEALTMVSSRITAAYLMKRIAQNHDPKSIADQADEIVQAVAGHFDESLSFELHNIISQLQDLMEAEGQTSH